MGRDFILLPSRLEEELRSGAHGSHALNYTEYKQATDFFACTDNSTSTQIPIRQSKSLSPLLVGQGILGGAVAVAVARQINTS
jgi:hypothetical protein